jgi:microsomal dipeptidase-like Zn-dependent dipeptidase
MNHLPPFVDIHVHPDLKSFLSSNDEISRNDCWKELNLPRIGQRIDDILKNILESQSSLGQLNLKEGAIAMPGLYAFEKAMVRGTIEILLPLHVNLIGISGLLSFFRCRGIMDHELMRRISWRRTCGFNLFSEAHTHLLMSMPLPPGYKVLKNISDYDHSKLNLILTAEGGHNLFKKKFGCGIRKQVKRNIRALKEGNYRFLFLGPAHIERNSFCTHAYAIKILKHRGFIPRGAGITRLGRFAIRKLLKNPGRILIDIKHMSLGSRKQYYRMLEREYRNRDIPIIASHVGVTGESYERIQVKRCIRRCRVTEVVHMKKLGHVDGTQFNPWSINLYDEEIVRIVESKGLIGLSLDARILGARQKNDEDLTEYYSNREFICPSPERIPVSMIRNPENANKDTEGILAEIALIEKKLNEKEEKFLDLIRRIIRHPGRYKAIEPELNTIMNELEDLEGSRIRLSELMCPIDLDHLCNNIIHILKVGGQDAWKYICIGSDFDGLVEAVKCCRNVTQYNSLSVLLKARLRDLSPRFQSLLPANDINSIVDGFMSHNAYNFLLRNFN